MGLLVNRLSKLTGGKPVKPFVVLTLIAALTEADLRLFGVLGPEIKDYFGLDLSSVGALLSVAGVLAWLGALPGGFLPDRVRRTRRVSFGAPPRRTFRCSPGVWPNAAFVLSSSTNAVGTNTMTCPAILHYSAAASISPPPRWCGI